MDAAEDGAAAPRSPVQQRLHEGFLEDRRYLRRMATAAQDERDARVEAVLELKRDLDTSASRVAAHSALLAEQQAATRAQHARAHQELLEQGRNPYEEARRRVVTRDARQERHRLARRLETREAKLLARLEAERLATRRREQQDAAHEAFERQYQREMGRAALDERTRAYLVARSGRDTLDATGKRVRVYPSQETTLKDSSFGLGRSAVLSPSHRARVVAAVLAKPAHRDVQPSALLLPRARGSSPRNSTQSAAAPASLALPPLVDATPGQELREMNHALLSTTTLPPLAGGCERRPETPPRAAQPRRSVLQARQRQQQQEEEALCARGAFLATPAELWFRDFAVGRALSLRVSLTNVSRDASAFRLLPLADAVRELFRVSYDKPGRLAAGMSCSLRVTFTAVHACDLRTELAVATPNGVLRVPVRCTCRKAVPQLSQRLVRFEDVVAGDTATLALSLANLGALPLDFCVRRRSEADDALEATHETPEPSTDVHDARQAGREPPDDAGDAGDAGDVLEAVETAMGAPEDEDDAPEARETPEDAHEASEGVTGGSALEDDAQDGDAEPLSVEEQALLRHAQSLTRVESEDAAEPLRFTRRGVVAPYSSSRLRFTFAPVAARTPETQHLVLDFPSSTGVAAVPVVVSTAAAPVPVFATPARLDWRCCAYDQLYRHRVTLCNRGKVALKLQLQVPPALAGALAFTPSVGFVQAASASSVGQFPVHVQFRPSERLWPRLERAGLGSRALGMLAVPVRVLVPDQRLPVFFLLTARLTPTALALALTLAPAADRGDEQLQLDEHELRFGECCVGHSVTLELALANTARVPQRLGVTRLPADVRVLDASQGLGLVLLPGESRRLQLVFEPRVAGALAAAAGRGRPTLVLRSATFQREYVLACSGAGVAPSLALSHSVLRLGATALGHTRTASVRVRNRSERHTLELELQPPREAARFLTLSPLVARLAPCASVRLELAFCPTRELWDVSSTRHDASEGSATSAWSVQAETSLEAAVPPLWTSEDASEDADSLRAPWRTGVAAEEPSCHHTWTVLCFQRVVDGPARACKTPLQALEVRTTAVLPAVQASPAELDFGQVAIGQTRVRELTLAVTPGERDVLLRAEPLHVLGAFRLLGAVRALPAGGGQRVLRVEFAPRTPLVYEDELALDAPGVKLDVRLRGQGINPSLSLSPCDGRLDFQDVLARTRSVRELVLANDSAFPLAFRIAAWRDGRENEDEARTATGLPAFSFSPQEASIPAHGRVAVAVAFQPDHQRPAHYAQRFRVHVPNESERHLLTLSGRCWENQLYVFAPDAANAAVARRPSTSAGALESTVTHKKPALVMPPVEDAFDLPPSVSLGQLASSLLGAELQASALRKPPSTIVLTFLGHEREPQGGARRESEDKDVEEETEHEAGRATKTLFVGSTAPSGASSGAFDDVTAAASAAGNAGATGSFELVLDAAAPHAKLFTLEPMRGAVAAGQQLAVQVTYRPPTPAAASATGSDAATSARSSGGSGRPGSGSGGGSSAVALRRRTELEVEQWIQVRVQCVLKGGSLWRSLPPATGAPAAKGATDAADTRVVSVLLRARLQT